MRDQQGDSNQATVLDEAYAERNAVVLAFAHMAELMGWTVGKLADPVEPDWPVLMIDTPAGQVSWHFMAHDMPATMPDYPGVWDGHSTPEKYERLRQLVGGWAVVRQVEAEVERLRRRIAFLEEALQRAAERGTDNV